MKHAHRYDALLHTALPISDRAVEHDLIVAAQRGDRASESVLVASNLRFVYSVARMYMPETDPDFDDLFSAGREGLLIGIRRHDTSRKIKLVSYAVWWIRQRMSHWMYDHRSGIIYAPWPKLVEFKRLKARREAQPSLWTPADEARYVALSAVADTVQCASIDSPVTDDAGDSYDYQWEDAQALLDLHAGLESDDTQRVLTSILKTLPICNYRIIYDLYLRPDPVKLSDIARSMKCSRENVRQLKVRTLHCLEKRLHSAGYTLSDFIQ